MTQQTELIAINRDIKKCMSCLELNEFAPVHDIFLPEDHEFSFQASLNQESSILFFSSSKNKYFKTIILDNFPLKEIYGMVSVVRLYITESVTQTPILVDGESIYIDPIFSIEIIIEHLKLILIPLINKLSNNGILEGTVLACTLFNRGNQLEKSQALFINQNILQPDFIQRIQLLDTETIHLDQGVFLYDSKQVEFISISKNESITTIEEQCQSCNKTKTYSYHHLQKTTLSQKPNKIISFLEAEDKLPFFVKLRVDQWIVLQFLFSKTEAAALSRFCNFISDYAKQEPNTEWYLINSDLLSDNHNPNLFLNQSELLGSLVVEAFRGSLSWKKDKFLDLYGANKLTTTQQKINDPISILGETNYKEMMLKWIQELENFPLPNNDLSYKVLFR